MRRRPWLVGLTGGFGSGKSTVARLFRRKGARVLSSDRIAHEVFRKGNPVYPKIRALFHDSPKKLVFTPSPSPLPQRGRGLRVRGKLDRQKIAEVVFQNARKRRALEHLVHPYVFRRIKEEQKKMKKGVLLVEVPLLFETGFDRQCDRTITVLADRKKILKRLARKGYSPSEIRARLGAQMPVREKARRSDEVIDNSGTLQKTRREVNRLWKKWSPII